MDRTNRVRGIAIVRRTILSVRETCHCLRDYRAITIGLMTRFDSVIPAAPRIRVSKTRRTRYNVAREYNRPPVSPDQDTIVKEG